MVNYKISEDYFKDKIILITGGAGFLGSWLSETLVKLKSRVFCIDNLSTGIQENMVNLKENELFEFEKMDVIKEVPKKNYDFVIHMASRPSPEDYFLNQIETLRITAEAIKNVLETAKKNNSVFLYTSTSEVYGDPQITPTPETYWVGEVIGCVMTGVLRDFLHREHPVALQVNHVQRSRLAFFRGRLGRWFRGLGFRGLFLVSLRLR